MKIFIRLMYLLCLLTLNNIHADENQHKNNFLTVKGIDYSNHSELPGDAKWTFVNTETNHVINITGKNLGTKIKVLKDYNVHLKHSNSIYYGDWLVTGISEPYTGLSTIKIHNKKNKVIKINMILKEVDVVINAPDEAIAGTVEKISWDVPKTIPGKFTLQKKGDKPMFYASPRLFTRAFKDSKYDLKIPAIAGDYLLRFYSLKNTKKAIFEKPLKILPATIKLNAPDKAIAGTEIDLSWEAPETSQAKINLKFSHNKPDFNARYHVRTLDINESKLLLPSHPGDYVLRWFSAYDRQLMLEKPIKLIAGKTLIKAPLKAESGQVIKISWEAPKRSDGLVFIIPDEDKNIKPDKIIYTKGKDNSSLTLPTKPGKYLIRFLNQSDYFVAAEHVINIVEKK